MRKFSSPTQDMLPQCKDMCTEHHNRTFITGLIRGNYEDKRSPRWCKHVDGRRMGADQRGPTRVQRSLPS